MHNVPNVRMYNVLLIDNTNNRTMARKTFVVSFERTFKIICTILLQIFYILLGSSNILTQSNELMSCPRPPSWMIEDMPVHWDMLICM